MDGVPPFLCVVSADSTIEYLKNEISKLYEDIFRQNQQYDVSPVSIRWLEDSQHHALPLKSKVGILLVDREKIYACTRLDPTRLDVLPSLYNGEGSTADQIVARWRASCEETAQKLSALAHQDESKQQVFESGGLPCLLCMVGASSIILNQGCDPLPTLVHCSLFKTGDSCRRHCCWRSYSAGACSHKSDTRLSRALLCYPHKLRCGLSRSSASIHASARGWREIRRCTAGFDTCSTAKTRRRGSSRHNVR
jgi:hypothetical protein